MPLDRSALARHLVDATQLQQQLERSYLSSGIDAFDRCTGGLPRGAVTEIFGPASSGKTTFLNHFLAHSTAAGEHCALIDGTNVFDPRSADAAGADLTRLLWVRCRGLEQALKSADLLVHAGGWGVVALDVAGIPPQVVRRLPSTWWHRFRRAVEHTPTAFVVLESEPYVKSCAEMALEFPPAAPCWTGSHPRFHILSGSEVRVTPRKPVRSRASAFRSEAVR